MEWWSAPSGFKRISTLCYRTVDEKKTAVRKTALDAIKMCLLPDTRPEFAAMAVRELIRNREKIMDYPDLLRFVFKYGSDAARSTLLKTGGSNPKNI